MSALLKRWTVMVTSWQAQSAVVHAISAAQAEAQAERLWANAGGDRFQHEDGGIDHITVEEVRP